jgi:hypothetical protein
MSQVRIIELRTFSGDAVGFMALILLSFSLSLLSTGQCSQNSNPQSCLAHPKVADMSSLLDRELSDYYTEISTGDLLYVTGENN